MNLPSVIWYCMWLDVAIQHFNLQYSAIAGSVWTRPDLSTFYKGASGAKSIKKSFKARQAAIYEAFRLYKYIHFLEATSDKCRSPSLRVVGDAVEAAGATRWLAARCEPGPTALLVC
jgi:hypothetical protein